MANLRHRAVAIISQRLHHQRDTAWTIALVSELFVIDAFFFTRTAADRAVNGVVGHIARLGVADRLAQTSVGVGITAAGARRDG